MTNQELVDYIRNQLNMGFSPEEIRHILTQRGWYESEISEAFEYVRQVQRGVVTPAPPKPAREMPREEPPREERPPWERPSREEPPKEEPRKGRSKKKIIALVAVAAIVVCVLLVFGELVLDLILYGIGLFNPSAIPPSTALGFNVFGKPAAGDWSYSGTDFSIKLPAQTYEIEITLATAQVRGMTSCSPITNMQVQAGRNIELNFKDCGSSPGGTSYSADISVTHTRPGMPLEMVESGTVTGISG